MHVPYAFFKPVCHVYKVVGLVFLTSVFSACISASAL